MYVLEQLDKGLIDFGLIYGPVDKMKYDFLEMPRCDEFGVLMREDSRLAEKERISPEDLWDQPLIVSSQNLRGENETMVWLGRAPEQLDMFTDYEALEKRRAEEESELERENRRQKAILEIKKRYGKNALLLGVSLMDGATAKERNEQIGGHQA